MVKVGIIGSGFGLYGLLPAFNSTIGCKVVSICGKKTDRLVNYCQSIGLNKTYTSWQEMLEKEKLDAIAIAVIPSVQYKIAETAIKKGLHVFAEKPLATTYRQAKELLNLAKRKKIVNGVDFIFPEIAEWKKAKEIIDKGTLGKLEQINLNWDFLSYDIKNQVSSWKTNVVEGGGALSYYFSHSLYYLEYLAGEISSFKSILAYSKESLNGGETGLDLLLKFKNKITGSAHLCCNNPALNRHQLIFVFEKGTLVLENTNSVTENFYIKIYTDGKIKQLAVPKGKIIKGADERVKTIKKLTTRFIKSIIYEKEFTPGFKAGVRVQELIEQIRKQSKQ